MAKARTITKHVERKVTRVETVPVTTIHLELTDGDADFLIALLSIVGGNPRKSPRKYAERISNALEAATGTGYDDTDAWKLMGHIGAGAVEFNDYPDPDPDAGRENPAPEPAAKQPDHPSNVETFWVKQDQNPFLPEPRPMFSHPALYDAYWKSW